MTEQQGLIGVDLGGTKIEVAVIKPSGEVLFRDRVSTEREKGYERILENITHLVEQARATTGVYPTAVGLGIPGVVDSVKGVVINANTQVLNGKAIQKDLAGRLQCNVKVANDANCFALAEYHLGVVAENFGHVEVMAGLIIGTGVGGGIVVNGRIINGLQGIAGEWGHTVLQGHQSPCFCGKRGCVETVISGPAIEKYYQDKTGQHLPLKMIADKAGKGDQVAGQTLGYWLQNFGLAVSQLINILDPDVLVVGGGVGNLACIYEKGMAAIEPFVLYDEVRTRICKPSLGDSAGVFGAAMLTY